MFSKFSGFTKFISIWSVIWFLILFIYYIPEGFKGFLHYVFIVLMLCLVISSPFLYNKIRSKISLNPSIFKGLFSLPLIFLLIIYIGISTSAKKSAEYKYFIDNKIAIYNSIVNNINKKLYDEAIEEGDKYQKYNDSNINNYIKIAKQRKEIAKQNQDKIDAERRANEAIIEKENEEQKKKDERIKYLKNNEPAWLNTIKDDGKTNVSFVIKDMAAAYEGLLELYPDNQKYQERGKYWIDFNNEQIKHQKDIENAYSANISSIRKYLRNHMKNPDSLDIVSEKYYDHIDEITIEIIYRATNSYNATITDKMLTRINLHTKEIMYVKMSVLDK